MPADYWQKNETVDCEDWLQDVHDDFQFFVECHESMFEFISLSELTDNLKKLQSQLFGLVFLDETQSAAGKFNVLIDALEIYVFQSKSLPDSAIYKIWRQENPQASSFAFIESDLSDLRSARMIAENFVNSLESAVQQQPEFQSKRQRGNATVIVHHPQLQASNLRKL